MSSEISHTSPATPAAEPADAASPVEAVSPHLFEAAADREATAQAIAAAAPVPVEPRADLAMVHTLASEARPLVYALLASLADNKYLLGRRYAEWCTGAPLLESAVAASAMAQDELGHARSFYPLLRGFPEVAQDALGAASMEERGWQDRPTRAVASLRQPFAGWSDFVAANLLLDTAFTVLFEAATTSPYEPLGQRARKIRQEEEAHWVHARGWAQRLANDARARPTLAASLEATWDDTFTWYGLPDDPVLAGLVRLGILAAGPGDLRDRLRERLVPTLEAVGQRHLLDRALPWDRWNPQARRLRAA